MERSQSISYRFQLYVAGEEPNSKLARENISRLCREHLRGEVEIRVIDVLQDFQAALDQRIFVTPALIKEFPEPRVILFGNLSDRHKVCQALGLPEGGET